MTTYSFAGLPNANPWVASSDFAVDGSGGRSPFKVVSGALGTTGSASRALLVGKTWGPIVSAKVTLKGISGRLVTDDTVYVAIVTESGPNQYKGYVVQLGNGYQQIGRYDDAAWTSGTGQTLGTEGNIIPGEGDTYELVLDTSNGALSLNHNGTVVSTATDTTYASGMTAAFEVDAQNHGGTGISALDTNDGAPVSVSAVSASLLRSGQTGVTITGTNFKAAQGTGKVRISPSSSPTDVGAVDQTVTSWGDTSIVVTAVRGSLAHSTNLNLFVQNSDGTWSAAGTVVEFRPNATINDKLVDLAGAAVTSATGITLLVYKAVPMASAAPDLFQAGVTTDASGLLNVDLNSLNLANGATVWAVLLKDGVPARASARKITPTFS